MKVFSGFLLVFSLTYISQSLAQIDLLQNPQSIPSGQQGDIVFRFRISDRCSFRFLSATPDGFDPASVSVVGMGGGNVLNLDDFSSSFLDGTFTLSVNADLNACYKVVYRLFCTSYSEAIQDIAVCVGPCPSAGVDCDPHFNQYIFNRETNETTRICYDVIAEPNQYLEIFTQPKMETRLMGQMKDDYYMHKIILQLGDGIIEADVDQILIFTGARRLLWNSIVHDRWTPFRGILFKQSKNTVEIKRYENDELTFGIVRSRDSVGKYYLDVFINGLSTDYSGLDGLLGRIGNNRISVYPNVQSTAINGKTTVVVNGMKTIGYETDRYGKECAFINVNDLLTPKKLRDYIIKEL